MRRVRSTSWKTNRSPHSLPLRATIAPNLGTSHTRTLHQWITYVQGTEPGLVMHGTYVRIELLDVPEAAAAAACDRVSSYLLGASTPLVAMGLGKHESKMSVVNMAVKRLAGYEEPIANKEEVTVVTGLRSFPARPVLSTNDYNADKFKMEKFMHAGRTYVMSVFAPIAFPPLPVLIVKQVRVHPPAPRCAASHVVHPIPRRGATAGEGWGAWVSSQVNVEADVVGVAWEVVVGAV